MRSGNLLRLGLVLSVAVLTPLLSSATHQDKPIYKSTGSEGTIVGTISFAGEPPKPRRIDTSADPVCQELSPALTTDWEVVTEDNKLANVVVYVRSESLNQYTFETPSVEVTLEHNGCRYVPHVLGIQTQQTLKVLNSDPTTHNTHATPKYNPDWNQSQAPGAEALEHRFKLPELFFRFKCNQHPWEMAYMGVFSHPFFSVSATNGTYRISGVPPGQYSVVAWHEILGEQTVDVFLAGSEHKTLDFTFKATKK